MTTNLPSKTEDNVEKVIDWVELGNRIYNSVFTGIVAGNRQLFLRIKFPLLLALLIFDGLVATLVSIELAFIELNKNLEKLSEVVQRWLNVGLFSFVIFGAELYGKLTVLASLGAMFVLQPFIQFAKTVFYAGMMTFSNTLREKEFFFSKVKENHKGAWIVGIMGAIMIGLLTIPGAQPFVIGIPLAIVGIAVTIVCAKKIGEWGSSLWTKMKNSWNNTPAELGTPALKLTISGNNMGNQLALPAAAVGEVAAVRKNGYFSNAALYKYDSCTTLTTDIKQHITLLENEIAQDISYFNQNEKRTHKKAALEFLLKALAEWQRLLSRPNQDKVSEIKIGEVTIQFDNQAEFDIHQEKEALIKLLATHVIETYPKARQSFFRYEKGDTEALFERVFTLMRQSQSEADIDKKIQTLEQRTETYAGRKGSCSHIQSFLSAVKTGENEMTTDNATSVTLPKLHDEKAWLKFRKEFIKNASDDGMSTSFSAHGERAKLFEEICDVAQARQLSARA